MIFRGFALAAALFVSAFAFADNPKVVGWRGDGTGCYPLTTPPTVWGRVNKNILGVTSQAKRPGTGASGRPIADGVIREWLVLGPVPLPAGTKPDAELLPGEANLSPNENQRDSGLTWKLVKTDSSYLNFGELLGKGANVAAYAHAYIYSPEGLPLIVREMRHGKIKVWLNGKELYSAMGNAWNNQAELKVKKGWNSLLLKVLPDGEGWYVSVSFYGGAPWNYESKNIAWTCATPNKGNASPIIVGDKIFVTSEPYDLCCVNKADGKILWVRSNNYFETLTKEEKATLPDVAKLANRLNEINDLYGAATPPDGKLVAEKRDLENKINAAMKTFNNEKYTMVHGQDAGYAGMTPVSDGKNVWAWFATGVSACYDLDGKRLWTYVANDTASEHGFSSSPALAGDKFVVHMVETIALNAKTGKVAWKLPANSFNGSLLTFTLNGEALMLSPDLIIVRAKDGKVLYRPPNWTRQGGTGQIATPVVKGGMIYRGGEVYKLPATAAEPFKLEQIKSFGIATAGFPKFFGEWYTSSPLVHDGLLYCANNDGTLSVVDIKMGKVLYQRMLDVDICYNHNMAAARGLGSSLALAGKRIYAFGNLGAAVVFEPGPAYKEIAKNRIENAIDPGQWWWHQESSVASPVFEGNRLYYRAEDNLYCIGEK